MSESTFRASLAPFLFGLLPALALGQSLSTSSPFVPVGGPPAAKAAAAAVGYDLVGMVETAKGPLLSISRQSDKRGTWIAVGATVNEITAVSYDPDRDEAVIRADGQTLTLAMRKSTVVAGANVLPQPPPAASAAPAPGAPPPPPGPPLIPGSVAHQEREARMLVSDLLEIGQQQRKAYEDAQRQAALKAVNPRTPPAGPAGANGK